MSSNLLDQLVVGNTSFMVQAEEEMNVFLDVFRKYYFQDIIML